MVESARSSEVVLVAGKQAIAQPSVRARIPTRKLIKIIRYNTEPHVEVSTHESIDDVWIPVTTKPSPENPQLKSKWKHAIAESRLSMREK